LYINYNEGKHIVKSENREEDNVCT